MNMNTVLIEYKSSTSFNEGAIAWVTNNLRTSDLNYVLQISLLASNGNVLRDKDSNPYNEETLAEALGIENKQVYGLLSRLCKANILSYMPTWVNGSKEKIFIMNPHFAIPGEHSELPELPELYLEVFKPLK